MFKKFKDYGKKGYRFVSPLHLHCCLSLGNIDRLKGYFKSKPLQYPKEEQLQAYKTVTIDDMSSGVAYDILGFTELRR